MEYDCPAPKVWGVDPVACQAPGHSHAGGTSLHCSRCLTENPVSARFCGACGTHLDVVCSTCGASNPAGNRFCYGCGSALAPVQPESSGHSADARQPLHSQESASTEGERKQVTVLFADVKGSLELIAERDPEDARELLDAVIQCMVDAVRHFGGTVNHVMGDGIMALFGAPVAQEDHAFRACNAALRMQETVTRVGRQLEQRFGVSPMLRVGLNSGEVVVRSFPGDLHDAYSAIGPTTHLAARMEQISEPGKILISEETWRLVQSFVRTVALGEVTVRGLGHPTRVFQLVTGVLVVTARLSLTLPTPPDARTTQAFERLSRLSFKMGLSLEDTQQIEEFSAGGNAAEETPAVAADLPGVFGSLPGRRWIG
jgi:class 3 adenylate cyclase